jgi:hypothetical protein
MFCCRLFSRSRRIGLRFSMLPLSLLLWPSGRLGRIEGAAIVVFLGSMVHEVWLTKLFELSHKSAMSEEEGQDVVEISSDQLRSYLKQAA